MKKIVFASIAIVAFALVSSAVFAIFDNNPPPPPPPSYPPSSSPPPEPEPSTTTETTTSPSITEAETPTTTKETPTEVSTNVSTDTPEARIAAVEELEKTFICRDLGTMRERIGCVLRNEAYEGERGLNYLPEECRALTGLQKANCVNSYIATRTCFENERDADRVGCAWRAIGFRTSSISDEKLLCAGNQTCRNELIRNVDTLIKFRIYNLEEKAEELLEKGVSEETVLDFIASVELKKQEYNRVVTIDQKKIVVAETIVLWKDFVVKAKKELGLE